MSACEHCGHELAGAIATVEECDEDAPLRNMAPLAVRVPRLPVRGQEAHPALRTTKTASRPACPCGPGVGGITC